MYLSVKQLNCQHRLRWSIDSTSAVLKALHESQLRVHVEYISRSDQNAGLASYIEIYYCLTYLNLFLPFTFLPYVLELTLLALRA